MDDGEEKENIELSDWVVNSRLVGSQYLSISCRREVVERIYYVWNIDFN